MRKIIAALFIFLAASALAQIHGNGQSIRVKGDSSVDINGVVTIYTGLAEATYAYSTPSESKPIWKIIKTMYDADGNFIDGWSAYGAGQGDKSLWGNVWTNRINANYK